MDLFSLNILPACDVIFGIYFGSMDCAGDSLLFDSLMVAWRLPCDLQAYRLQYKFDAISGMPTNLYGPHDNFHPDNSHVLPALIRRFHEAKVNNAKEVVVWGTGSPFREFLHVDDLAEAAVFLIQNYSGHEHVNMGSGSEVTIKELAEMVKEVVGFQGQLTWDTSKPDGTPRKLIDSTKLANLGWQPRIPLKEGLVETYKWYCENYNV